MAAARNPLEEMGRWLKEQGIIQRERTEASMVALALFLYAKGLEYPPGGSAPPPGGSAPPPAGGEGQSCSGLELDP
jgi:hypothetical protein